MCGKAPLDKQRQLLHWQTQLVMCVTPYRDVGTFYQENYTHTGTAGHSLLSKYKFYIQKGSTATCQKHIL